MRHLDGSVGGDELDTLLDADDEQKLLPSA
jgi:hypothetical protein